jgi:hypothetical protein
MRIVAAALVLGLAGLVASPARAADGAAPVAPLQPYDAPRPLALPPPAPATDDEPPDSVQLPQVPPGQTPASEPSEAGLILIEGLLGFPAYIGAIAIAGQTTPWLLLAAPLVAGGVVCGIGHASQAYDGSCGSAISGAYVGTLLAVPLALIFAAGDQNNQNDWIPMWVAGAALGFVLGPPIGAIVGWNLSREPKERPLADAARLDAVASARATPWREPLLARGSLREDAGPRAVSAPVLAFRF